MPDKETIIKKLRRRNFKYREIAEILDVPIHHVSNTLKPRPYFAGTSSANREIHYKGFIIRCYESGLYHVDNYGALALGTITAAHNVIDTYIRRVGYVQEKDIIVKKEFKRPVTEYSNKSW